MEDESRAPCHENEWPAFIDAWEAKHSTPVGPEEMQAPPVAVHLVHEAYCVAA